MFEQIDREVDGRIVRQTYIKPFGTGYLVLVSTTFYAAHTMPDIIIGERQRQQIMFDDVPIESITESLTFVPKGVLDEDSAVQTSSTRLSVDACPTTGETDCQMCSGEYCETHGTRPCDCDTADRHRYDPSRRG